jgi:GDP-D-mannose 3',5'-epimerase
MSKKRVLVTGASGFIGHHLVTHLKRKGLWVRGADIKRPEYTSTDADEFQLADLRKAANCVAAVEGVEDVYHLAADMGGIGYISVQRASIAYNDTCMNLNMLEAARAANVRRFLYSSSACIYPHHLQTSADVVPLREEDAWPAQPEEGYGLEKLFAEKMCEYYTSDWKLQTRVVRFHNVYGPLGTYQGGREKAPAALCRKIALAADGGTIEVWGDGMQTRSFMYIDDCVDGIQRIMESGYDRPLNLGTDELLSVNEMVGLISAVAGKRIDRKHDLSQPQGVRGRNSDNSLLRAVLGWEPRTTFREGIGPTYAWIEDQLASAMTLERNSVPAE